MCRAQPARSVATALLICFCLLTRVIGSVFLEPDFISCEADSEWRRFRHAAIENAAAGSLPDIDLHAEAVRLVERGNRGGKLCAGLCTSTADFGSSWLQPWAQACAGSPKFREYADAHHPAWRDLSSSAAGSGPEAPGASCPYGYVVALTVAARHEWPAIEARRYLYLAHHMLGWMLAFAHLESSAWGRALDAATLLANLLRPGQDYRATNASGLLSTAELLPLPPGFSLAGLAAGSPATWPRPGDMASCRTDAGTTASGDHDVSRVNLTFWLADAHASQSGEVKEMCTRFVPGARLAFLGHSLARPQCLAYGLCAEERGAAAALLRRLLAEPAAAAEVAEEFQRGVWPAIQQQVDVLVCSVPAIFCRLYLGLDRPILGYLALPPLHSVPRGRAQQVWYGEFQALRSNGRNTFVSFNTHLSASIAWQFGPPSVPVVRLFGWHTNAYHIPSRLGEVLVARHGKAQALQECLLERFAEAASSDFPLRFVQLTDLLDGDVNPSSRYNTSLSFPLLASFRSVVFWPNDFTLVLFYELYSTCTPLFLPKHFWLHSHGQSTLSPAEGDAAWRVPAPPDVPSPFTSRHFDATGGPFVLDAEAAAYWGRLSDFHLFPHVQRFVGIPDLMNRLLGTDLQAVSSGMRSFNRQQLAGATRFWRDQAAKWVEDKLTRSS